MKKAKIFIIDDHPITIQGLTFLLESHDKFEVCGTATNATDTLAKITNTNPDLVIVDILLGDRCGLELTKSISNKFSQIPVLIYSMHEEFIFAERAFQVGAKGYLVKSEPENNIFLAIDNLLSGKIYLREDIKDHFLVAQWWRQKNHVGDPIDSLSDRELRVFRLLGDGLTTKQIAHNLHLSFSTVDSYKTNIKRKLNLENVNQLICYAAKWSSFSKSLTKKDPT